MTSNKQGFAVNSYTSSEMGQINRVETGEGWGDVSYGKSRQIQRGLRTITIVEKLVRIPNARMVEEILTRTFKNVTPTGAPASPWYQPRPDSYPTQPQE